MLQFNTQQVTNKNAVYLDTVNTGSGYYDSLRIAYSQSYDQSSGTFTVTADSLPTAYRNWLTISNEAIVVPTPTGQYDVELYTTTEVTEQATWTEANKRWTLETDQWNSVGEEIVALGDLLYSDRAFISSSITSTTEYSSPNENGKYTTYNG
jgi:hypothetical protein